MRTPPLAQRAVVDARDAKDDVDAVVGLMVPGGTAYLDDFANALDRADPRRDAWLRHEGLAAVEIRVAPGRRAIVALRVRASPYPWVDAPPRAPILSPWSPGPTPSTTSGPS